jgi:hypothetical protein
VNLTHGPRLSEAGPTGRRGPGALKGERLADRWGWAPEIKSEILNSKLVELVLLERLHSQGLKK